MFSEIEKGKNFKDDLQSFDDFVVSYLEKNHFQITLENKIALGGLKGLVLKIAQKIIHRILEPIIQEQNAINSILYSKIKALEKIHGKQ